MAFSDLEVDVTKFRETDSDLFNTDTFNDSQIKALGKINGLARLQDDSYTIFDLTGRTDAETRLNSLVSQYEAYFKTALLYAQLAEYYRSKSGGFDELNNERSKVYDKMYISYIKKFYEFKPTDYTYSQTKTFLI